MSSSPTLQRPRQKFTNTGTFLAKWGSTGSGDGNSSARWASTVDGDGNVFVVDDANDRIQKFTPTGTFAAAWGRLGIGDGVVRLFSVDLGIDGDGNCVRRRPGKSIAEVHVPERRAACGWNAAP